MTAIDPPASPSVLLVRHAKTAANARGVLMGTGDAPLTDDAADDTRALGLHLATMGIGSRISQIYTSDLGRAISTAEIIAESLGVPVKIENAIRERDFGEYNGAELRSLATDPFWAKVDVEYSQRPSNGGESLNDVDARLFEALDEIDARTNPDEHILCVGHSTCWRLVTEVIMSRRQPTFGEPIPANLSVGVLSRESIRRAISDSKPGEASLLGAKESG